MKKLIMTLLLVSFCLSAYAQFFSDEEKKSTQKEKKAELKTEVSIAKQKVIYLRLCAEKRKAKQKAEQMNPVKIQQTPEKREAAKKKAHITQNTLLKHYKVSLAAKYQITEEYLEQIDSAGKSNNWPKSIHSEK